MGKALHVVATAGHVDHGKSSLVLRLTGMDPDRFAEEKRRGLTIDLGFAWFGLPSGHEIGFVDVPGHERFVRNMLAGVGPVRLVLFAVAADEGWEAQSEEHLAIVDLLGADGGIVALTKTDLVDRDGLERVLAQIRERLRGTTLESAPVVPCSARTGEGMDELVAALDEMVATAPSPRTDPPRPRLFVDRVFAIKGAGTVVTGTLTGGAIAIGDEAELYPTGHRGRIRGLQTHKRPIERALPVSRVAVNFAGAAREDLRRGDVLALPGQWHPTTVFEARVRRIRGLDHPLTPRGAHKLYAGSAERDAHVRFYATASGRAGETAFARIRVSEPVVLDVFDRFVLREAGRHATVAGGVVLDIYPPLRPGADAVERLEARERATRDELPALLLRERGAVRATDVFRLTGAPSDAAGAAPRSGWLLSTALEAELDSAVTELLEAYHRDNPLRAGADIAIVRTTIADALAHRRAPSDPGLVRSVLDGLEQRGVVVRSASEIQLASHTASTPGPDLARLVEAIARSEPTPPTITELVARGFGRDLISAAVAAGALLRISPDLVMTPAFVGRAREALEGVAGAGDITVSAFREAVGTSRKYAVPLLGYFDAQRITVRRGDVRALRRSS